MFLIRYADRVKELGVSDNADDGYKTTPLEKEPDANGTNDVDYSRLSNLNVSVHNVCSCHSGNLIVGMTV